METRSTASSVFFVSSFRSIKFSLCCHSLCDTLIHYCPINNDNSDLEERYWVSGYSKNNFVVYRHNVNHISFFSGGKYHESQNHRII